MSTTTVARPVAEIVTDYTAGVQVTSGGDVTMSELHVEAQAVVWPRGTVALQGTEQTGPDTFVTTYAVIR